MTKRKAPKITLHPALAGTADEWPVESTYETVINGQVVTVKRYAEGVRPLASTAKPSHAEGYVHGFKVREGVVEDV
jgi:hypothetical protein